jgi:hypothetical protein
LNIFASLTIFILEWIHNKLPILTIKWDLPIKRRTVGDMLNQKEFYESDNEGLPSRKQFEKVYDFPFSMSLVT